MHAQVGLEHLLLGLCAADKRLLSSSKLDLEKGRRILRELRTGGYTVRSLSPHLLLVVFVGLDVISSRSCTLFPKR